jgi:hypothetical protein
MQRNLTAKGYYAQESGIVRHYIANVWGCLALHIRFIPDYFLHCFCEKDDAFLRWLSSTQLDTKQKLITRPSSFLFCSYPMVYCRFSPTEPLSWFRDLTPGALFSKQKTNSIKSSLCPPVTLKDLLFSINLLIYASVHLLIIFKLYIFR